MTKRVDISSNPPDVVQAVVDILQTCKAEIQENMEKAGENASGMTSASLRVELSGSHVRLVMGGLADRTAPPETLELGVPPETWVPAERLFQWSLDKGIDFDSDRERWSFAFATKYTIHDKGTKRYTNHEDIYSTTVEKVVGEVSRVVGVTVKQWLWNNLTPGGEM